MSGPATGPRADLVRAVRPRPSERVPGALVLAAILVTGSPALAAGPRDEPAAVSAPWSASAAAGLSFGNLPVHSTLALTLDRRFWDRIQAGVELRLGVGGSIWMFEPGLDVSMLLTSGATWVVGLGWRASYSRITVAELGWSVAVDALAVGPFLDVRLALGPRLDLRLTPLAVSGYWSRMWAANVDLGAGAAVRF